MDIPRRNSISLFNINKIFLQVFDLESLHCKTTEIRRYLRGHAYCTVQQTIQWRKANCETNATMDVHSLKKLELKQTVEREQSSKIETKLVGIQVLWGLGIDIVLIQTKFCKDKHSGPQQCQTRE